MTPLFKTGLLRCLMLGISLPILTVVHAQDATIHIRAGEALHPVSRYLTGACIEDVNHEVYGGIDSQMIFGESFAEPAPEPPLKGFTIHGGRWTPQSDGSIQVSGGDGPKLVCDAPGFAQGEASVELFFAVTRATYGRGLWSRPNFS